MVSRDSRVKSYLIGLLPMTHPSTLIDAYSIEDGSELTMASNGLIIIQNS